MALSSDNRLVMFYKLDVKKLSQISTSSEKNILHLLATIGSRQKKHLTIYNKHLLIIKLIHFFGNRRVRIKPEVLNKTLNTINTINCLQK
jgi:hypothetical protein